MPIIVVMKKCLSKFLLKEIERYNNKINEIKKKSTYNEYSY